jgi:glycosyltransferase involved in cell wall biosynthesis
VPDVVLFHWWKHHPLRSWITPHPGTGAPRPWFVCVAHHRGSLAGPPYDRYVLVSPTQCEAMGAIDGSRVRIIPNGVDTTPFEPRQRSRLAGTGADGLVIGRLSSLRPGKIPDDWVRTAAAMDLPGAHWVIAGDGATRARLLADAATLKADDRITFPGYVPRERVPAMLASFDVCCYVTSSAVECHPLALIETALAGVPIVAEPRGGVTDVVIDGESGFLVTTPTEIEARLRLLLGDAALRRRLSDGARRIGLRFDRARMLAGYQSLLAELAEAGLPA